MKNPVLLEREAQFEELRQHAEAAFKDRAGRLVLIGGVAGSGKSSLVSAFAGSCPSSTVNLTGACEPMSAPRPLSPVHDFATRIGRNFAELLQSGADRHQIFSTLIEALKAHPLPHLLVMEDLHWADDATLDLVRFCGRRLSGSRVLMIGTYRHDEVAGLHPLRRVLGDLAGVPAVHRLHVPELTEDAVRILASGYDVDPAQLHNRTGGNPFFLTEVLAGHPGVLPSKVEDAVMARVSRLSAAARRILEIAAVIGPVQHPELLERVAGASTAVDECVSTGMLVGHPQGTAFRHDIAREAVIRSMDATRLRRYHAAVLDALEALGGSNMGTREQSERWAPDFEDLTALAHHASGAHNAQKTLTYALAAGRHARRLGAYREARVQFDRVLALGTGLDPEEHSGLLEDYASVCGSLSDNAAAVNSRAAALTIRRTLGNHGKTAAALMQYAEALVVQGEPAEQIEPFRREGLKLIESVPDAPECAVVYMQYAHHLMLERQSDAAIDWAHRAVQAGRRNGAAMVVASAYNVLVGVLVTTGRITEAKRYHQRCLEILIESNPAREQAAKAWTKLMLGTGLGEVYRLRDAELELSQAVDAAHQQDNDGIHHYALAWLALVHLYLGRWSAAGEAAAWVYSRPNASQQARIMAGSALGRLRLRRGDPEVWPVLDDALTEAVKSASLQRIAPVRAARAEAALATGDHAKALFEALQALPLAQERKHRWFVTELTYLATKAGGHVTLPEWATGPFALQVQGKHRQAASQWRRIGAPFEEARALAESGDVALQLRALESFRRLGAIPAAMRLSEELRRAGVRNVPRAPRKSTRTNPAGLTERESQVLQLLGEGLRNSEIAVRHGVSERTVGHQVSAVLSKLAVRTRAEAVNEARGRGLL